MDNLSQVKRNFAEVKDIRTQIKGLLDALRDKIDKLKHLYVDFIGRNHRNLDIFGLDSFHFQNKMLDMEYNHMLSYFNLVSNRMYGGYYKLYNLVTQYARNNIDDKAVLDACQIGKKAFPRYKDLEPSKVYDFELVLDIHHTIIQVITEMDNYLSSKKEELRDDKTRSDNGLNIENFIHAFIYKNTLLESQIQLFINYMTVFHKYHGKYLRRFRLKLMFMYKQIDSDVDLEQSGLNKGFSKQKDLRRRHSTEETVLEDIKGIVSTFGGSSSSPSSITPTELKEMTAVLQAEKKGDILGRPTHSMETETTSSSKNTVSPGSHYEVDMSEVSEVTDVPDNLSDNGDGNPKLDEMESDAISLHLTEKVNELTEKVNGLSDESNALASEDDGTVIT